VPWGYGWGVLVRMRSAMRVMHVEGVFLVRSGLLVHRRDSCLSAWALVLNLSPHSSIPPPNESYPQNTFPFVSDIEIVLETRGIRNRGVVMVVGKRFISSNSSRKSRSRPTIEERMFHLRNETLLQGCGEGGNDKILYHRWT